MADEPNRDWRRERKRRIARSRKPEIREIRADMVLALYARCLTQGQIADELGTDQGTVSRLLHTALEDRAKEDPVIAAKARALLNERLDILLAVWFPLGVGNDTTPPSLDAAEFALKLLDRQGRINGVDLAPGTVVNNVTVTADAMRAEIMASLDLTAERAELIAATLERTDRQDDPD